VGNVCALSGKWSEFAWIIRSGTVQKKILITNRDKTKIVTL
jgi:hypothetical protein